VVEGPVVNGRWGVHHLRNGDLRWCSQTWCDPVLV